MAQVKHVFSLCKVLCSIPSIHLKKKLLVWKTHNLLTLYQLYAELEQVTLTKVIYEMRITRVTAL
jgi:hypothetical protein